MRGRTRWWPVLVIFTSTCECEVPSQEDEGQVQVLEDHTRASGFYAAPFPSDALVVDGRVDLSGFPNPYEIEIVNAGISIIENNARGFARTGGVFFSLDGAVESGLPTIEQTRQGDSPVVLIAVDENAPDADVFYPLQVAFEADGGPHGARNLLSLLVVQGMPLRAGSTYVAAVRRGLMDKDGRPLRRSRIVDAVQKDEDVPGLSSDMRARWRAGLAALARKDLHAQDIAAMTVFTTDDPVGHMVTARDDAMALGAPPLVGTWQLTDTFPDYCVYENRISLPVFQAGTPPYSSAGGDWAWTNDGHLLQQRTEDARVWITVPRQPMPADGWPAVMMVRTGGGGDRPLMDRGHRATAGGSSEPGTGPAVSITRAGWAGVTWDGALGGLRNPNGGDEQFLVFNVFNPPAIRGNLRQTALEAILLAHGLEDWSVDASGCDGASPTVTLDASRLALLGHSMGASIAPLAMAVEPRFRGLILSGAGGSWLENVMYKAKPLVLRPAFEILLKYTDESRLLVPTDPVLTLVQWAIEDADAQVYAPHVIREPTHRRQAAHVLMVQGIVDRYILPNIANALSVPMGLDLAGAALDEGHPELTEQRTLASMLRWAGQSVRPMPVQHNITVENVPVTAAVVQVIEDGIEDGHEVFFQQPQSHALLECFLESWAAGAPVVGTCE